MEKGVGWRGADIAVLFGALALRFIDVDAMVVPYVELVCGWVNDTVPVL